jgi:hypothetical protein
MQIIYAAPFLLVAAMCFFACAAIPQFRKHALVVPVGVLSFGVGSLISYFIFAWVYKLGHLGPANWFYLAPYLAGGLAISIVCSVLFRMVVAYLPQWLISAGLVAATFASLSVAFPAGLLAIAHLATFDRLHTGELVILGLLWLVIALFISWRNLRISKQFRPDPCFEKFIARIFPSLHSCYGREANGIARPSSRVP